MAWQTTAPAPVSEARKRAELIAERIQLEQKVHRMIAQGHPRKHVAMMLDIPEADVNSIWEGIASSEITQDRIEEERIKCAAMYDLLLQSYTEKALSGSFAAAAFVLEVLASKDRLLGLSAPKKAELKIEHQETTTADDFLHKLNAVLGAPVIDGEVIENALPDGSR